MQVMELTMTYGYKGANCCFVRVQEEAGWIEVFNDYNEKMFSGGVTDFPRFLIDLEEGKYS